MAATATPVLTPPRTYAPIKAVDATIVPMGLAFDGEGNLYVSECSWTVSWIDRISPDGMLTRIAGDGQLGFKGDGGPATAAEFRCPAMMAIGPDGALYVADHANNRIRRIDRAGIITTVVGSGPDGVNMGSFSGDGGPAVDATLREPWGVAFDAEGNLFIADRDNNRVRRMDPSGVITTVAGSSDYYGYTGNGASATEANVAPLGIAIDSQGRLAIAEQVIDRVRVVDNGIIRMFAGTGTHASTGDGGLATAADLLEPGHVAFDSNDDLLVQTGTQIRRVNGDGVISTVIGSGRSGIPTDGMPALDAPFPELWGIATDEAGNIYIADGHTSVYRVDPQGVLHLFAGKQT